MEAAVNASVPVTAKTCLCRECGEVFTLSPQEQQWYLDKGYVLPERCPACRTTRRVNKKKFRQSVMESWFENKDALSVFLALKDEFMEFLRAAHPELLSQMTPLTDEKEIHNA